MNHLCPISGLYWNSPYIPFAPEVRTTVQHPVFSTSAKQLAKILDAQDIAGDSIDGYLIAETPTTAGTSDTTATLSDYLLHLATLAQLPATFSHPVNFQAAYPILIQHTQALRAAFIHTIAVPHHELPGLVIRKESSGLQNLASYLEAVQSAIQARKESARQQSRRAEQGRLESSLTRIIYAQSRRGNKALARILPDWADKACGGFPNFMTPLRDGTTAPLSEIWRSIISFSVQENHTAILTQYRQEDVAELITELEDSLELGTPYSTRLLRYLRTTMEVLKEFSTPVPVRHIVQPTVQPTGQSKTPPARLDLTALDDLDNLDSPAAPVASTTPSSTLPTSAADRIKALMRARRNKGIR